MAKVEAIVPPLPVASGMAKVEAIVPPLPVAAIQTKDAGKLDLG